jgi:hypothetical protein
METVSRAFGLTVLSGALILSGCASPASSETRTIGGHVTDSRNLSQPRQEEAAIAPDTARLIRQAVQVGHAVTGFSGHSKLQAVPMGVRSGCDAVTVKNRQFGTTDHYLVCDGRIQPRSAVAPARIEDDFDRAALRSVKRDALRFGSGRAEYQGYVYTARRVGLPDGQGCSEIEYTIGYDGVLVDRGLERACPDSGS